MSGSDTGAQILGGPTHKTDKNDARGLAQLVRMGEEFIKPVIVRSQASQENTGG
jgi:hypothetical protein